MKPQELAQQALGVGRIVDRETAAQADRLGVLAQDAQAQAMERGDAYLCAVASRCFDDALAHFAGGPIGEGHGEDLLGLKASAQEFDDLRGDDARLA